MFANFSFVDTKGPQTVSENISGEYRGYFKMFRRVTASWRFRQVGSRHIFGVYSAVGLGQFAVSSYGTGRRVLKEYRERSIEVDKARERKIIRDACQKESPEHLCDAIFWPAALIQRGIPSLVILTTPR